MPYGSRLYVVCLFVMLSSAASLGATDDLCPVTQPPVPTFEPPPDEAPKLFLAINSPPQPSDRFWYGTAGLWTWLRRDGRIGRRDKMVWWSAGYRGNLEQRPDLTIAINRVGSGISTIVDAGPTNAHFDDAWSIMTMFEFPEPGCWAGDRDVSRRTPVVCRRYSIAHQIGACRTIT